MDVRPTEAPDWSLVDMKTVFEPRNVVGKVMGTAHVKLLPVPVIMTAAKLIVHWLLLMVPLPIAAAAKLPPAWFR